MRRSSVALLVAALALLTTITASTAVSTAASTASAPAASTPEAASTPSNASPDSSATITQSTASTASTASVSGPASTASTGTVSSTSGSARSTPTTAADSTSTATTPISASTATTATSDDTRNPASVALPAHGSGTWGYTGSHGPVKWGVQPLPSGQVSSTPKAFATTNGVVYASAMLGNVLYIGGSFTQVITATGTSLAYSHLAALDATTGNPIPGWRADTDTSGPVLALTLSPDNSRLYVGGGFLTVNGLSRRHLAAVDPATGTVDPNWKPATDNTVWAIAVSNTAVYVGGDFLHTTTGSVTTTVTKIAALDTVTGAVVPGWSVGVDNLPYQTTSPANTDGRIQALTLSIDGSKLYIGGYINHVWHQGQNIDAVVRPGAAAVSTVDGTVDPNFTPPFLAGAAHAGMDPFQIISSRAGHLYVAIGGLRNVLVDVNPTTGAIIWKDTASNDFQTISLFNKYLYAGGHIHKNVTDSAGTHTAVEGIRVNPDNGLMDTSWTPGFGPVINDPSQPSYYGVWTMLATPAGLYVGGAFLQAGGVPRQSLAFYPAV